MISRAMALARAMSRADVEPEPAVRPLGATTSGAGRSRRGVAPLLTALQHVVEEDRMRLAGIAAPEDDQIGVLDLTI